MPVDMLGALLVRRRACFRGGGCSARRRLDVVVGRLPLVSGAGRCGRRGPWTPGIGPPPLSERETDIVDLKEFAPQAPVALARPARREGTPAFAADVERVLD